MNSEIVVFTNEQFGDVRTICIDGETRFIATDIAKALGYSNQRDAIRRHVDDEDKGVVFHDTLGGKQQVLTINESGLYSLVLSSKLPTAKEFKHWITSEVLPSIRRNGAYVNPAGAETPEELIARALKAANEIIARREQRIAALETETQELRPRAAFAEAVEGADTSILIRDLARMLTQNGFDIGQNSLFKLLRKDGYLIRAVGRDKNRPTRRSMEMGLMEVKETAIQTSHGAKVRITPLITGKGQVYFLRKYAGVGGDE